MDAGTGIIERDALRGIFDPTTHTLLSEHDDSCFANGVNFLKTLAQAVYNDARDLYVNRASEKSWRALALLNHKRLTDDLLSDAIEILQPRGRSENSPSPALYYLLLDARAIRAKENTEPKTIIVKTPFATSTKQMEWAYGYNTEPSGLDLATAVDRAIGGVYSVIHSVTPKFDPQTGDLPALLVAHEALVRGAR